MPSRSRNSARSPPPTASATTTAAHHLVDDKAPGAFAVTQTTSGPAQVFRVVVPAGVRPGSEFNVLPASSSSRRTVRVRCPISSGPGKTLQITIPPEPTTTRSKLTRAQLTSGDTNNTNVQGGGGALPMTEDTKTANAKRLQQFQVQQQLQGLAIDSNNDSSGSGGEQAGSPTSPRSPQVVDIDQDQPQEEPSEQSSSSTNDPTINSTGSSPTTPPRPNSTGTNATTPTTPKAFLVTIPPHIQPGMPFTIDVQGKHYVIHCPPDAGPGQKVKIVPPQPTQQQATNHHHTSQPQSTTTRSRTFSVDDDALDSATPQEQQPYKTQLFEVRVPSGVSPGQPFALLAHGQRVLVTCPNHVHVGQKLRFHLPVTPQMVQNIQLNYNNNNKNPTPSSDQQQQPTAQALQPHQHQQATTSNSSGWCRTIRVTDLKFQWVRVTKGTTNTTTSNSSTNTNNAFNNSANNRLLDMTAMDDFDFSKSAYGRKLTLLQGNDRRLRTGVLTWVPAKDCVVDSKLVINHKVVLSYADLAQMQAQPLPAKLDWLETTLAKNLMVPWEEGHVKLNIRRRYLLMDSVDAVMSLSRTQLRQRWRLEFLGEPAIDAGGVTREWFQLVSQQLLDPNFGLWMASTNHQACSQIHPSSGTIVHDHLVYFRFFGRVLGRALLDRQLIHGHLVRPLYKHILGWPITFEDLQAQDEEYYSSLEALLEMDDDTLEAMCLDFTVTEELMGVRNVIELIPNGGQVDVTRDNLVQFLEAKLRYHMLDRTKPQLTELLLGFFDVVPEPVLTVFDSHELELILCGLPTIDMEDWKAHTKYTGRFDEAKASHKVVKWFWDVVTNEFDAEMKARLLQFVTGTSGVPSRGFSVLQGNDGGIKKFCLQGVEGSVHNFPRAHTCFNRLDLPLYRDKGELRSKLRSAITLSAVGFDMD